MLTITNRKSAHLRPLLALCMVSLLVLFMLPSQGRAAPPRIAVATLESEDSEMRGLIYSMTSALEAQLERRTGYLLVPRTKVQEGLAKIGENSNSNVAPHQLQKAAKTLALDYIIRGQLGRSNGDRELHLQLLRADGAVQQSVNRLLSGSMSLILTRDLALALNELLPERKVEHATGE